MGWGTDASGNASTAMGYFTTSDSFRETVIGSNNTLALSPNASSWVSTDRLFTIGNGEDSENRSNAMTVLKNGNVGIGTDTPSTDFQVSGINGALFSAGTDSEGLIPATGPGARMMWYARKRAFRAGYVSGTQWDDMNVGTYSVAMGSYPTASGNFSTAMGIATTASGYSSTAMGNWSRASGT